MTKAVALLFIALLGLATSMSTLVMATSINNCAPGVGSSSCPLNAAELGVCVDVLAGLVDVTIGDPAVTQCCCPVLAGVSGMEAALSLCSTIRLKLLNLNVILPVALELFVQCGLTPPPPGFTCPPLK